MLSKIIENQISEDTNSGCVKYSNKPIPANIIIQLPTILIISVALRKKASTFLLPTPTTTVTDIMSKNTLSMIPPRPAITAEVPPESK